MSLASNPAPLPGARPGFTVAETLIALGVLVVVLTGAATLMSSAFGTYRHQDRSLESRRLVHNRMETLTATAYAQLKQQIEQARYAQDPPRGSDPTSDFVTEGGGSAISRYELEPPTEGGGEWRPRLDSAAVAASTGEIAHTSGTPDPRLLKATLQLQYWDAQFDVPAKRDSGLIRASFTLSGPEHQDRAVKYFAR